MSRMLCPARSVAGRLTVFVTRTRDPFWSRPEPAPILFGAVIGTHLIATGFAVYGVLMTPPGWGWTPYGSSSPGRICSGARTGKSGQGCGSKARC